MEVSAVPNLNVLPVCLPFPKEKRQNVVKVVKGNLVFFKHSEVCVDEYAFLAHTFHLQKIDACG